MLNITLLITFIFSFVTVYASDLAINGQYIQMETMKLRSSIKKTVNFKPHPDTMHELTFAVKQNNADKMHDLLMERSTPGQPLYQQWMSNDEVRALTSNPEASSALLNWFSEHGIAVDWVNRGQEYFRVRTHIGAWEKLLRTSFHEYHEYDQENKEHITAVRAESYSLPASIAVHVSAVFGAVDFPVKARKFGVAVSNNSPVTASKPSFLRSDSTATVATSDNHISAQATAVTGYVQVSEFASSTCDGTALRAIDYAIGPCIPISVADGTNSFQYAPSTDSTVLVNYFTDTACTTLLATDVPAVGVCNELLNSHGSILTVFLSTTTSPIPSFLATSLTVIRGYIDKYSYIILYISIKYF